MSIGFPHRSAETGGPGSFQLRLSSALEKKGWRVVYPDSGIIPEVVLVVGGTAKLRWLWKCKAQGAKIIHRLDGVSWRHRVRPTAYRMWLRQESGNWLMRLIRRLYADHVVYQSYFVQNWWREKFGQVRCEESVIYNGVDLSVFSPKEGTTTNEKPHLLCVEGNLQPDIPTVGPLEYLARRLFGDGLISGTIVCGNVEDAIAGCLSSIDGLELRGNVPRQGIHEVYTWAVYLSLDINAACPNSAIEALASGIPVIGFDTGALSELVRPGAGILVPYGGDPWRLQAPDISALEQAARKVLSQWYEFSKGARALAEERFGLDEMVDSYLAVFEKALK